MKVFISWTGEPSRELASILREWLPYVVPAIKPWMSEEDIDKGARWSDELAKELATTHQGIVCVTRDNLSAPWLNYEAGSLAKAVADRVNVHPVLLGMTKEELTGPLKQFQATMVGRPAEVFQMLQALNRKSDEPRSDDYLRRAFDRWWDELRGRVDAIPLTPAAEPEPSNRELLQGIHEVLRIVRQDPAKPGGTPRSNDEPSPGGFPHLSTG